MKTQKIILDTNVLFAGLYSASGASYQILRLIEKGNIVPIISTTLLFEYEDVLKRKQSEIKLTDQEIDIVLDNICNLSEFQSIYFLWRPYLKDPKDDHVLELAVASQTNIILTHNMKDFINIHKFGIQAKTPKKFMKELK